MNSREGGVWGRRAAALPPQEDPTIVVIHPYIQISICPYQYQFISIQSKIHNPEINDLLVKKHSTSLFGIFWSSDWYHIEIFRTHFSIRIYLAQSRQRLFRQNWRNTVLGSRHMKNLTNTKTTCTKSRFGMQGWNSEMQVVFAYPMPSILTHFQPILIENPSNPIRIKSKSIYFPCLGSLAGVIYLFGAHV